MIKLYIILETKILCLSKVVSIINKMYKIISKLVSKLAIKVLATNILDYKLVSERLIETNFKYKVVSS